MSGIGASRPLRGVVSPVRFMITEPAVSRRGGNWPSCSFSAISNPSVRLKRTFATRPGAISDTMPAPILKLTPLAAIVRNSSAKRLGRSRSRQWVGGGALAEGVEIGDLAQAALVNYNIVRLHASLGSQDRPNSANVG